MASAQRLRPLRGDSAKTLASAQLAGVLRAGEVYRRKDLARVSNAVDRHLRELVSSGQLKKLAQGLYYAPKQSAFGVLPPADEMLVAAFLGEQDFLLLSPASYNALGLGLSQLYNLTIVYNHKRHGRFSFGKRQFDFRVKPRFPQALSDEFLFVDLLNNLDSLAEDKAAVLRRAQEHLSGFDQSKLRDALENYGSPATKKRLGEWLNA